MAAKLESIRLVKTVDEEPDLSWLGHYASSYGPNDVYIDRQERGHAERGQNRFFISGRVTKPPRTSRERRELEQDYRRMEDYGNGWVMVGVYAEADVLVNGVTERIRSGGLYGIESDSSAEYFDEVGQEEYDALKGILKEMGVRGRLPPFSDLEWRDR